MAFKILERIKKIRIQNVENTVNFQFMSSNLLAAHAYGVYISQLIRYSGACASYQDLIDSGLQLTIKLLSQVFLRERLESSLRKFFGRYHDLVDRYEISISQMTMDIFRLS